MMTMLEIATMQVILLGLQLFVFWACTLLPIMTFVENCKQSKHTKMKWLRNFIEVYLKENYLVMNVIMTILLIGINDFRAVLISSLIISGFNIFNVRYEWNNYKSARRAEERELRKQKNELTVEHKCKIIKFPPRAV